MFLQEIIEVGKENFSRCHVKYVQIQNLQMLKILIITDVKTAIYACCIQLWTTDILK